MQIYYGILDEKRLQILPKLQAFKQDFYLAGGTGLALLFGHRDSVDFDFFSLKKIEVDEFSDTFLKIFEGHKVLFVQKEQGTLTAIVDDEIKISFFEYQYRMISPFIDTEYFQIASVEDIACMKLSAICSRSLLKDYIDLYFILQKYKLADLLTFAKEKFIHLDEQVILKSLVYFEDVIEEPVIFKNDLNVEFKEVQEFLEKNVKVFLQESVFTD